MAASGVAEKLVRVVVNGRTRMVPAGSTLLEAAKAAHVDVPTLCYHPRFKPKAVCRMCLVEVNGGPKPVPACYTKVQDGDEVVTDSEALRSFRKADGQFLLARHPNDCMRCEVSGDCKLQSLVRNEEWEDKWPHFDRGGGKHPHELHDYTSPAILRDMDKCIECGLCVDACGPEGQNINVIGFAERSTDTVPVTVFDKPLNETACISCGQCTWVCPVGALTERPAWHDVSRVLRDGRRTTVVQVAPATRVAISEEFDMPPGTVSTGRLVNALREAGFTFVFDTNFAADLTIMEEGTELVHRLQAAKAAEECTDGSLEAPALPLFTSCCPGWVNYVELSRPDLIPHLSTTKSPQQMHGVLTKRGPFASGGMAKPQEEEEEEQQQQQGQQQGQGEEEGTGTGGLMVAQAEAQAGARAGAVAEEPFVVSIMPCTAKKDEAHRPGLEGDVDAVLTTRELARLLRAHGVKFGALPEDGTFDNPLGESTGAAAIFGASGGVLEAALRTAAELVGIADAPVDWNALRGTEMGVKVASVPGVGRVAAISGIGAASRLLADPEWVKQFIMVEVMACPGGCLGGGGEPKSDDPDVLAKRARGVYSIDADAAVRHSHHNESVQRLYAEFLGAPLSHTSHKLLHTAYAPRHSERDVLRRFLSAVDARDGAAVAELFAEDGVWCTNAGVVGADAAADADAGAGAEEEEEEEAADGGGGGVTLKGRTNIAAFITDVLPPNGVGPAMQRHLMADAHRGMRVHAPNGDTSEFTLTFADDGRRIASLERRVVEE